MGESDQNARVLAAALVFTIAGSSNRQGVGVSETVRARPKTYFDALELTGRQAPKK